MKKLLLIPAFLLFMSATPVGKVGRIESKPDEPIKVDKLNLKLHQIDSLINSK